MPRLITLRRRLAGMRARLDSRSRWRSLACSGSLRPRSAQLDVSVSRDAVVDAARRRLRLHHQDHEPRSPHADRPGREPERRRPRAAASMSIRRTGPRSALRACRPLEPGESTSISWSVTAVTGGRAAVYVVVLPEDPGRWSAGLQPRDRRADRGHEGPQLGRCAAARAGRAGATWPADAGNTPPPHPLEPTANCIRQANRSTSRG